MGLVVGLHLVQRLLLPLLPLQSPHPVLPVLLQLLPPFLLLLLLPIPLPQPRLPLLRLRLPVRQLLAPQSQRLLLQLQVQH